MGYRRTPALLLSALALALTLCPLDGLRSATSRTTRRSSLDWTADLSPRRQLLLDHLARRCMPGCPGTAQDRPRQEPDRAREDDQR